MKIKPPLHADQQLDQFVGQCEIWRQVRPSGTALKLLLYDG